MANKFKIGYSYYVIGVTVLILIGILSLVYFFIKDEEFKLDSKSEIIYKNNYKIDINYPVFNNKKVNDTISKIVEEEKKIFLETIDEDANYENELNVNYSYSIKDKVYSVHLRSYSYTGEDAKYYRNDNVFYFDSVKNKELSVDDLITDKKFYEVLKDECYEYLDKQNKFSLYEKEQLNDALLVDSGNYELIIFSEDSIYIIFTPHTISPYDGEISIPIKYDNVKIYLNNTYFSSLDIKETNQEISEDEQTEEEQEVEEETFVRIRDYKQFEGKKLVALTFDDGPAYNKTETLLNAFKERDVRVTFFVLGEFAVKQPNLLKRAYDEGHTIGSHTYDHKSLKKLNDEQLSYEIDYTNQVLKDIIGEDIKFLRPPYGSYNQSILNKVDMSFILWNKDTEDWALRDADKLAEYLVNNIEDGDIVLMHDIHQPTIDGVIKALDMLEQEEYAFVSLEELIAYRGIDVQTHTAYRSFKVVSNSEEEIDNTTEVDNK